MGLISKLNIRSITGRRILYFDNFFTKKGSMIAKYKPSVFSNFLYVFCLFETISKKS
jgi:hypothetical protein